MELLEKEHMATSISLLAMAALDTTLDTMLGMHAFLATSGYATLVRLAAGGLQTRLKFSLASLLTKCHLSELLERLSTATGVMGGAVNGHSEAPDLEEVAQCLEQVREVWEGLGSSLAHPPRHLPSLRHYAPATDPVPAAGYFTLAATGGLVEVLCLLLTHPTASDCEPLAAALHALLGAWLKSREGLLFLAGHPHTGALVAALLGAAGQGESCPRTRLPTQLLIFQEPRWARCWGRRWCTW